MRDVDRRGWSWDIRSLRIVAKRLDAELQERQAFLKKGSWRLLTAELGLSRDALCRELSMRRRPRY
jgi:CRP/FNR family transcriptional regulator, dissimilatory nitrate respiration regulator